MVLVEYDDTPHANLLLDNPTSIMLRDNGLAQNSKWQNDKKDLDVEVSKLSVYLLACPTNYAFMQTCPFSVHILSLF